VPEFERGIRLVGAACASRSFTTSSRRDARIVLVDLEADALKLGEHV
jgi:hypothetical protein